MERELDYQRLYHLCRSLPCYNRLCHCSVKCPLYHSKKDLRQPQCPLLGNWSNESYNHPGCHRAPALGSLHRTSNEYNITKLMRCHFLDDITKDCGFYLGWWFSCYLGLREAGCQHVSFLLVRPGAFTARNMLGHSQCGPEACLEPCEPRT